jgi:hypothetical protein
MALETIESCANYLHVVVNDRRGYPNVGDLKRVMREVRDALNAMAETKEKTLPYMGGAE